MSIFIKLVIKLRHVSKDYDFERFVEWEIPIDYISLAKEINRMIEEMRNEIRIAFWKALPTAYISNVKIFVDEKLVAHTRMLPVQIGELEDDEKEKLDSDMIASVVSFTKMAGSQIAFEVIQTSKFLRQ